MESNLKTEFRKQIETTNPPTQDEIDREYRRSRLLSKLFLWGMVIILIATGWFADTLFKPEPSSGTPHVFEWVIVPGVLGYILLVVLLAVFGLMHYFRADDLRSFDVDSDPEKMRDIVKRAEQYPLLRAYFFAVDSMGRNPIEAECIAFKDFHHEQETRLRHRKEYEEQKRKAEEGIERIRRQEIECFSPEAKDERGDS